MRPLCTIALLLAALTTRAHADDAIATYAIVVGSNAGGPGQTDLRYAEDDARRVGQVLTDLGGYQASQVDIVVHPTPDELRARIATLAAKLAADEKAGRKSRVFFYYSGHARAEALDLGKEQIALADLRQRLFALPTTLTVVVLDACQSGAFSRVKGAAPAADFSFNSRTQLDATGVAVLASSSGSELSQESEQLKSSYFTHHLLVGMRGAADTNKDGLVTIDEAYRYAYHQTLLATAETAVGGQHVSLEVDLKGHGEVALAFPRVATAHIELPASLEGKTLVEDKRAKTVVAETYKAAGATVRIAVAPGEYRVLVRRGTMLARCEVASGGVVELDRCTNEALAAGSAKGGARPLPRRYFVGASAGGERDDDYTRNLEAFGYREQGFIGSRTLALGYLLAIKEAGWVGIFASYTAMPQYRQDITGSGEAQTFDWWMLYPTIAGRLEKPLLGGVGLFTQVGLGPAMGFTRHTDADGMETSNVHFGFAGTVDIGLHIRLGRHVGLEAGYQFVAAPAIDDLIGNTHFTGGARFATALTYER